MEFEKRCHGMDSDQRCSFSYTSRRAGVLCFPQRPAKYLVPPGKGCHFLPLYVGIESAGDETGTHVDFGWEG